MTPHICIFLPNFDNGGVERMLVNLAYGMWQNQTKVDFIVADKDRPYIAELPPEVTIIELQTNDPHRQVAKTAQYLNEHSPNAILSAKEPDIAIAEAAIHSSRASCKLFIRAVVNHTQRLAHSNPLKRWLALHEIKKLYAKADGIIAVSQGVADDLLSILGSAAPVITTANNPVITPTLQDKAKQSVTHQWFGEGKPPVILGIGRISRAKNFPLLIKSFAQLRQQRECRLMILGSGKKQDRLLKLANKLGVREDIDLLGYQENPYAFLKHASLFVLSSLWEGSPNVLTEALATGCPVVSTDCPSGPKETLQNGKFGPLVPVNDVDALTKAMSETLDHPLPTKVLVSATESFTTINSAKQYLKAMGYGDGMND